MLKYIIQRLLRKVMLKFDKEYDIKLMRKQGAKIGRHVWIGEGSFINPGFRFLIEIGNDVTLSDVTLLCHDGSTQHVVKKSRVGKCIIGNNVFIGYHSIVLPNVRIGNNVIIGAGSVVINDIPDNSIAAGNPCKIIGQYSDFGKKHKNYLDTHPVYPTYHRYKSKEEILKMQNDLSITWGYDE